MSEDKKHTPGPWKVRKLEEDCFIEAPPNNKITRYGIEIMGDDTNPDHYPDRQKQADAEFIVRACNSHYELVALLKGFVEAADNNKVAWPIVIPAAAAIAKAEGK